MRRRSNPELKDVRAVGSNMTEAHHGLLHILYSYKTPVAILAPSGLYKTEKMWSRTTSKHIGKWFRLWNLDPKGAEVMTQEAIEHAAEMGKDPKNFADEAFVRLRKKNPRRVRISPTRAIPTQLLGRPTRPLGPVVLRVKRRKRTLRKANPLIGILGNPPSGKTPKGKYLGKVTYIEYTQAYDGKFYYHDFRPAVYGLVQNDGSLLLYHPTNKLWKLFEMP